MGTSFVNDYETISQLFITLQNKFEGVENSVTEKSRYDDIIGKIILQNNKRVLVDDKQPKVLQISVPQCYHKQSGHLHRDCFELTNDNKYSGKIDCYRQGERNNAPFYDRNRRNDQNNNNNTFH